MCSPTYWISSKQGEWVIYISKRSVLYLE